MLHIWKQSCKPKHTSVPFLCVTDRPHCQMFKSKANPPPPCMQDRLHSSHFSSILIQVFTIFSRCRQNSGLFQSICVLPSITEIPSPNLPFAYLLLRNCLYQKTAFVRHFSLEAGAMESMSLVTSFLHQHLLHHQPSAPTVSHELQTLHRRNYVELEAALIYVAIQIAL